MIFSLDEFWSDVGLTVSDFYLPDRRSMEADALGPIVPTQIGQRTWRVSVSVRPYERLDAQVIKAKIEALKEVDVLAFIAPPMHGAQGEVGVVSAIKNDDRRAVKLTNVSVGVGDYVGINNGDIYSLHQVFRSFTDDGGVVSDWITVIPPVPISLRAGDEATTDKPKIKTRINVDARGPSFLPVVSDSFSIEFYQVLT